jgi:predicted RNA binding protein YcfA (HicA-like mRNA interferase family)
MSGGTSLPYSTYAAWLPSSADIRQGDCEAAEGGRTFKSQSGSHVKLSNEQSKIVIVPVHGNKDLGRGLVKKLEKETGVKLL